MHHALTIAPDVCPPDLHPGCVHLWLVPLEGRPDESLLESLLTPSESERAARYRLPRVKRQFVVGRGLLRWLLGYHLGCSPREVVFEYGASGKPHVAGSDLQFNLSHTDEYALLALVRTIPVGVDLERVRRIENLSGLVERFFAPGEQKSFARLSPQHQEAAFFRGWTCKEAVLKALGQSVQLLDRFEVELSPYERPSVLRFDDHDGAEWTLRTWLPMSGHAAALALPTREPINIVECDNLMLTYR